MIRLLRHTKSITFLPLSWTELWELPSLVLKTFVLIVLPLSLLPPVMLLYAGADHPLTYLLNVPYSRWQIVAAIFFMIELLAVPAMGWAMKAMAAALNIRLEFRNTFLLAAIATVPLWISSLVLAISNLWLMILIVIVSFFASASLLYRGAFSILGLQDHEEAQVISSATLALGGIMWAMLCTFIFLPLMI